MTVFMDLPPELRLMIYRFSVFRWKYDRLVDLSERPPQRLPGITRVCRESRAETLPIYFGEVLFVYDDLRARPMLDKWAEGIGMDNLRLFRNLILDAKCPVKATYKGRSVHSAEYVFRAKFDFHANEPVLSTGYIVRDFRRSIPFDRVSANPPQSLERFVNSAFEGINQECHKWARNFVELLSDSKCRPTDVGHPLVRLVEEMYTMELWLDDMISGVEIRAVDL